VPLVTQVPLVRGGQLVMAGKDAEIAALKAQIVQMQGAGVLQPSALDSARVRRIASNAAAHMRARLARERPPAAHRYEALIRVLPRAPQIQRCSASSPWPCSQP
jgi:hypothetical protein